LYTGFFVRESLIASEKIRLPELALVGILKVGAQGVSKDHDSCRQTVLSVQS
jgi:hypothetical protein